MSFTVNILLNFSILIGGIIGMVRFSALERTYYPFLYFLWLGGINEVLSFWLASNQFHTTVNNNLYVLGASLLLLRFFKNTGTPLLQGKGLSLVACLLIAVWGVETFLWRTIYEISSYFRVVYSFIIVLLSIHTINQILLTYLSALLKNALFIICSAMIIYFTNKVLIEIFWIYDLTQSESFQEAVYIIMVYINFFVNLIYAIAILWIPRQQRSLLLS